MVELAGIIHPSAFQISELIASLSPAFGAPSFEYFRYKNLELGSWSEPLATNERKTIWAMLDGAIINRKELRKELEKSFAFVTDTDAELVVHAYDAWGEEFISRIRGECVIALFDEEKELLYLYRDRLGKKCLYWTAQGDSWLFSTKLKGLLWTGLVPQTLSITGLASYLHFGFIPQDFSPIKNVNKLLPCHYLKVDLHRRTAMEQYWSLSDLLENKKEMTLQEAKEEFTKTLGEATALSFPKEPCAFLNDSSRGAQALQAHFPAVATPLTPSAISPEEILQDLVSLVWHLDEPIADLSTISTWSLHSHELPLISPLGWKELLGMDPRYEKSEGVKPPRYFPDSLLISLCSLLKFNTKWKILRTLEINRTRIPYLDKIALFTARDRKKVSPYLKHHFDPNVFTQRFHRLLGIQGSLDPLLYFDAKTRLPDALLLQSERLYPGVTVTPFIDHHVIECLARMPEELKPQLIEDPIAEETVPEAWRLSPHFRHVFALLEKGRLVDEGLLSPKWIHTQLGYPFLTPQMFREFWSLLIYEIWFRLYIDKPLSIKELELSTEEFLRR